MDALVIIKEKLDHDESLCEQISMTSKQVQSLIELCPKSTYFRHRDHFYEQAEGTALGSPLPPVHGKI